MNIEQINFHHLRYFWAVAKDGNLTRTAARLRVAQSAVSSQIQQLEAQLGQTLFRREGRRLILTEAGKIALAFTDEIFTAAGELISTLQRGRGHEDILRLGAVATLSRNFQESFIRPLLGQAELHLSLESGGFDELLLRLGNHELDMVLTNRPALRSQHHHLHCRRLARQPVSIVGPVRRKNFEFPETLANAPLILPGRASDIRSEFDALCTQLGISVRVLAEVDDMATLRLLARDAHTLAVVPSIVVRDELRDKVLYEHCRVPGLFETFYAITCARTFQHPLVDRLLERGEQELLTDKRPRALRTKAELGG